MRQFSGYTANIAEQKETALLDLLRAVDTDAAR